MLLYNVSREVNKQNTFSYYEVQGLTLIKDSGNLFRQNHQKLRSLRNEGLSDPTG